MSRLLLFLVCSALLLAAFAAGKNNYVFIGNPGTGKSTLLNSLVGKEAFNSGVSIGRGLTDAVQIETDQYGNQYIDTPGLSCLYMRKKAASEIKKGLTKGGNYRIFFVITLEEGRFRLEDLTTIKLVLNAVPTIKKDQYSIIINKLSEEIMEALKDPKEKKKLTEALSKCDFPETKHIFQIPFDIKLKSKKNKLLEMSFLKNYAKHAPGKDIKSEDVKDIKHEEFEITLEKIRNIAGAITIGIGVGLKIYQHFSHNTSGEL